ncbi:MAG: hypothetical protein ACKVZH_18525 [Blastocatellia bacterium]
MNLKKSLIACLLTAISIVANAQPSKEPSIPETPAGRMAAAYVKAFNSGDPKELVEFMKKNDGRPGNEIPDPKIVKALMGELGKLSVAEITWSKDHQVTVALKAENGKKILLDCYVETAQPHKINQFRFELIKD